MRIARIGQAMDINERGPIFWTGRLAVRKGLPRLVPLHFELSVETPPSVTFHFNAWVFNFMREKWALVGAKGVLPAGE